MDRLVPGRLRSSHKPLEAGELEPGDHILVKRNILVHHHGIYVGEGKVIHFRAGLGPLSKVGIPSIAASPSAFGRPCVECGLSKDCRGVVVSCLRCFDHGSKLYRYMYGVPKSYFKVCPPGTCTTAPANSVESVVYRAIYLLYINFGRYNIFWNNCEDFALYCKTGLWIMTGPGGRSGQVANLQLWPLKFIGLAGTIRLSKDIGRRSDVQEFDVEALALYKKWISADDDYNRGRLRENATKLPPFEKDTNVPPNYSSRVGCYPLFSRSGQ